MMFKAFSMLISAQDGQFMENGTVSLPNLRLNILTLRCALPQRTGARSGAVNQGTVQQAGRTRVRFMMVSLEFFIDIKLPAALWSWGGLSR
jgi:hypothetical protein